MGYGVWGLGFRLLFGVWGLGSYGVVDLGCGYWVRAQGFKGGSGLEPSGVLRRDTSYATDASAVSNRNRRAYFST